MFFYDILIYGETQEDHIRHLKIVFELLQSMCCLQTIKKCIFGQCKVEYLGHVISAEGVATEEAKTIPMKK